MKNILVALSLVVFPLSFLAGCPDPAADKPKAVVEPDAPAADAPAADAPAADAPAADAPAAKSILEPRPDGAIDFGPDGSSIAWVGSKVTGSHDGGFKAFKGWINVPEGSIEKAEVRVEIDTGSIFSDNEKLTGHLQTGDFFLVADHPKASFRSTSIAAAGVEGSTHLVTGELTIRGVTKTISFPATLAFADGVATAKAEFGLNRKPFGVSFPGMPDDLIRDQAVVKLDVKAGAK